MKNLSKMGFFALLIAISFFSCDPPKGNSTSTGIDSLKKDSIKKDSTAKVDTSKKDTTKK